MITVGLGDNSYDIHVDSSLLPISGEYVTAVIKQKSVFIITDQNVAPLYLDRLTEDLLLKEIDCQSFVVPAGEEAKSFEWLQEVLEAMIVAKCERGITVIALGGGVVGDLAGFASSVFLRGVDFIQVPTTLLAQVDSSVGGKTGINTSYGKNLVGAFHQPKIVIADIDTLDTLERRQLLSGYAEVIKYGLIMDADFWNWLGQNWHIVLDNDNEDRKDSRKLMIERCCKLKADIVSQDEKEKGVRALLNLGHTFAHALEADTGYDAEKILHGEAVAVGIILAFDLSVQMGLCSLEEALIVKSHIKKVGLPSTIREIRHDFDVDRLLEHMTGDKKVKDGKVVFVLPKGIGKCFICDTVKMDDVREVLQKSIA
ncbi:MAG: 3-dehydroquinate synthase [Alphaproteobacteria bacterium]|nr:3-dehydroquinate synthase [Alphaproteobacteria bacterium]